MPKTRVRGRRTHLLKLGADATPRQVTAVLEHNARSGSNPITCDSYDLVKHALGWQFAIDPTAAVTGFGC